ncbi:MAG TPA: hypothetical protein VF713_14395, partial [Thermoanaerobaculia bacterium]
PVCIASSDSRSLEVCRAREPQVEKGGGPDFARLLRGHGPNAAIHIVGLGDAGVGGFFRRNDVPNAPYHVWRLHGREDDFIHNISERTEEFGKKREDAGELANIGEQMYGYLFASEDPSNHAAHDARAAFEEFARPYLGEAAERSDDPPTLYIRFMQDRARRDDDRNAILLPLALAKIDDKPGSFLGFRFKIETPLQEQITDGLSPCISNWKLFLPADDDDFHITLQRASAAISRWSAASRVTRMRDLRDWLAKDQPDPNATALVVLSHSGKAAGDVRLAAGKDYVASGQIRRTFDIPSIAILNGCGAAAPGSERFVKVLNAHGVDAVIAARCEVGKEMAADFFDCLACELPSAGGGESVLNLADIHYRTIRCLRKRSSYPDSPAYGAAALAYGLYGNSELSLCGPQAKAGQ